MIHLVIAWPDRAWRKQLEVGEGTTVAAAIASSGAAELFPELLPFEERVGIHGRRCAPETVLRDGDRIEFYRLLLIDPKDARRKRASDRRAAGARPGPGKSRSG